MSIFPQGVQAKIGWLHNLRHSCRVFFLYKAGHSGVKTREMPATHSWHTCRIFVYKGSSQWCAGARARLQPLALKDVRDGEKHLAPFAGSTVTAVPGGDHRANAASMTRRVTGLTESLCGCLEQSAH